MSAAIVILQVSLNPGKYNRNLQFGTIRKFRSTFSNAYHASAEAQDAMVMAKGTKKLTVTKCTTYGLWFERFMKGSQKRMREIVRPDRALSSAILVEILKLIKEEWMVHHINISVSIRSVLLRHSVLLCSMWQRSPLDQWNPQTLVSKLQ
jgi:hypothetical protein